MQLRNHPAMSSNGNSIWPPEWIWTFGGINTHPVGEIGIFESMQQSTLNPSVCFLTMSHEGSNYVGRLAFDDEGFVSSSVNYWRLIMATPSRKLAD
jgi:hypothetical protein